MYNTCCQNIVKDNQFKTHKRVNNSPVYGEFIRTFTFGEFPQLPIVQPGGSLVFPIPTVQPKGVQYIEQEDRVGLLVPKGVYLVSFTLNPSEGATVDLLINGRIPITPTLFPYGRSVINSPVLDASYLVNAPFSTNLISFINGGSSLFTLNDIPNTRVDDTAIITHIRVQRIDN